MKYKSRDELVFDYLKHIGYDVSIIESITPRYAQTDLPSDHPGEIDGLRIQARITEMNRNEDGTARWRTPAISVEHSKAIIIDYAKYTQFKRDKNLKEILEQ